MGYVSLLVLHHGNGGREERWYLLGICLDTDIYLYTLKISQLKNKNKKVIEICVYFGLTDYWFGFVMNK